MLNAQPTQFKLNDAGEILFQPVLNNPVPGAPVGKLVKGEGVLQPDVALLDGQPEAAKAVVEAWLKTHIVQVLEPLIALLEEQDGVDVKPHVSELIAKVFKSLGILPREELESLIAQLDEDDRRVVRSKKIKLGPILVFQPDLNKPAAVRLRAVLWSLFNDKPLPAPVPNDGVVSCKVEGQSADKVFYQAIGYPVYGNRAIRIDMLDRVINAIYDAADKGKFKAQHQMAEWLGCPIEDLYGVLSAMGHVKIYDPADDAKAAEEAAAQDGKSASTDRENQSAAKEDVVQGGSGGDVKIKGDADALKALQPEAASQVTPGDEPDVVSSEKSGDKEVGDKNPEGEDKAAVSSKDKAESSTAQISAEKAKPAPQAKPELATFALKRGKAFEKNAGKNADKKSFNGPSKDKAHKDKSHKGKGKPKGKGKRNKTTNREPRVMSAEAEKRLEDSPFAILSQLKDGSNGG